MNYCLDSNTVIYCLKGKYPNIQSRLRQIRPKNIFILEVVYAELLYGVARSQQQAKNTAKLEAFVQPFMRLPFDQRASPHYANIRAELSQQGEPIGPNDLLIASIVRAQAMTLVTHNTKDFRRVAGLSLEDWTLPVSVRILLQ
jgi:tRNA(fMet)-specific endonuclease VapC